MRSTRSARASQATPRRRSLLLRARPDAPCLPGTPARYATLCIRENPGCQFIATNMDAVTHLTDAQARGRPSALRPSRPAREPLPRCLFSPRDDTPAQEWAGNGSMVGAIKGSTKREPTVVGKPVRCSRRTLPPLSPARLPPPPLTAPSPRPPPGQAAFMLDYISDKFGVRKDQICMVGDRLDTDILFGKDGGLRTLLVLSGVTTEQTLLAPENKIIPDNYTDRLEMVMRLAQQGAGVGR